MKKQGFTLIELLVVIAIIAILAAILFPVFAQAREKARAVSCLSNMKQMQLAFMMYTQDFDSNPPMLWDWGEYFWPTEVYPYIKNIGLFVCPSDSTAYAMIWPEDNPQNLRRSYMMDVMAADVGWWDTPANDANVEEPANFIVFGEQGSGQPGWPEMYCPNYPTSCCTCGGTTARDRFGCPGQALRHSGGINWTFWDGHAKWERISQTLRQSPPANGVPNSSLPFNGWWLCKYTQWDRQPSDPNMP